MSTWLDTETKAILQQVPPEKDAPPDTGTFTLVLLRGKLAVNPARVKEVLVRIPGISASTAAKLAFFTASQPVVAGLSLPDALLWQFELICRDVVSVFLRDGIISSAGRERYLPRVYAQLRQSPEFEPVNVTVSGIPDNDIGERFVRQFLHGGEDVDYRVQKSQYTYEGEVTRKKARIMAHWAKRIGARVVIAGDD